MHIARVESISTRNRMDLDIQLRRIAQLQDEVDSLRKALAASAFASDSVLIPLPKTPVES
jgi:hypothetical protein